MASERRWPSLCALLVALFPVATHAAESVRVALYAPWGGPPEPEARYGLVKDLARRVEETLGRPATGLAFTKFRDFLDAVDAGKVDFSLVDAAPAVLDPKRFKILATWRSGRSWVLVSRNAERLSAMRGRPVALPADDCPASRWLVENVFFRGQLKTGRYFGGVVAVAKPADGVGVVAIGTASTAFAREGEAGELPVALSFGDWPDMVWVSANRRARHHTPDEEEKLSAAVSASVTAALGGAWSAAAPSAPSKVAPATRVLATPQAFETIVDFLGPDEVPSREVSVSSLWVEPLDTP